MKTKWIGLLLLLVVALGAVGYVWFSDALQVTEIKGYVGGEKIGLLEDEAVQDILRDRYKLSLDYAREGSIEMVTMDSSRISCSPPIRLRWNCMSRISAPRRPAKSFSIRPSCCTPTPPWPTR